ncbi:MAG: VTT domain-containing protein [Deltaproteobacteria bacterium]|nr:MAG: VTT domain-containing protein [Deltaproteobacteria bacterium]
MMKITINREWKIFLGVMLLCSLASAAAFIFRPELRSLVGFFFFTIPANSFTFVPYEPALLYYSKLYSALWLAILGGIGTSLAGFLDYQAVTYLFRWKKLDAMRKNRYYLLVTRYFNRAPFSCIVFTGCFPVPFHPIKFLAISAEYPLKKYLLALFVGRTPRYYILALAGAAFNISNIHILIIFAVFVLWEVFAKKILPVSRSSEKADITT